jgi:F0F1-type ATP synthase membrane subunit c/vacuolar-type H+-ATPase subunit K
MILILIFAEAVALYGFIISLMVATSNTEAK